MNQANFMQILPTYDVRWGSSQLVVSREDLHAVIGSIYQTDANAHVTIAPHNPVGTQVLSGE